MRTSFPLAAILLLSASARCGPWKVNQRTQLRNAVVADGHEVPAACGDDCVEWRYACGPLLRDSAQMLVALLDPWTGLPYDQIPCDGPSALSPQGINRAWGVAPQLAYAAVDTFAEDPQRRDQTVLWSFTGQGPDGAAPSLLYALKLELRLSPPGSGNAFGGLIWGATVDLTRYKWIRIRYSTPTPNPVWELKLNSGQSARVEPLVLLPGSAPRAWSEARFDIRATFPGTDVQHVNYIVFATHSSRGDLNPVLWVDQISFEADPDQTASCAPFCSPLPEYPDLACHEPFTGAVNIANALSALSLLPDVGLVGRNDAEQKVARILATMESFPVHAGTQAWFQDWHSPVSGMPDPKNRIASLTDQPQLYAALMLVERTWPSHAARAAALRQKMDFSLLVDTSGGCCLRWAVDRCGGVQSGCVEYVGRDSLLGSFLAIASGGAPLCTWQSLAQRGCLLDGSSSEPWYTTAPPCLSAPIPAIGTGGPFLQLAGLQYLNSRFIPLGPLSLADSARNMLRAQARYADENGLSLAGWANASDPDQCGYMTCEKFVPEKVTPYVWAMGLDLLQTKASSVLLQFHDAGADTPIDTGAFQHSFGLRDAWNQARGGGRDAYLYLDTGWTVLGLLNACHGDLVRDRFGSHSVAINGYRTLQQSAPLCSQVTRAAVR